MCKCGKKVSTNIMVCPYCKSPADQETQRKYNANLATCRDCKKTVSREATVCPHCGCKAPSVPQDVRSERTADGKMKASTIAAWVLFSILAVFAGFAFYTSFTGGFTPVAVKPETSPSSFSDATNLDITRALIVNRITDCGVLRWGRVPDSDDEYIVKCSMDGENWFSYRVWPLTIHYNKKLGETVTGKVEGPVSHEVIKEPVSYLTEAEKAGPKVERTPLPFANVTTIPIIDKTKLK